MIKLLVVDDSPLMRRLLGDLFEAEGDFEVSFARNGVEALAAVASARPDVITLDVQMPEMDGLQCLDRIMIEHPTPVVMASSVTAHGAAEAIRAMDLGAVDVIAKPTGAVSLRMHEFGPALVDKVRAAARARMSGVRRLRDRVRARLDTVAAPRLRAAPPIARPDAAARARSEGGEGLVILGASTGGPPALDAVLSSLPAALPWPVVVAQHMPASFTGALARRLNELTPLTVTEVVQPTPLRPGGVYIAHGDADMLVSRRSGELVALSAPAHAAHRWHPSVNRLVDSALGQLPAARIVGVLMTGMGDDGAEAMGRLHAGGGHTVAEAEATAVIWGMPGELVRRGGAAEVLEIEDIGAAVARAVLG